MNVHDPRMTFPGPQQMDLLMRDLMRGVNHMIWQSMGQTVLHGPFKGMIIPSHMEANWDDGNFSTKLLGSYEFELHDVVEHAATRTPWHIINVGSAEGYYAIGLARMLPAASVVAIDLDDGSLALCRSFATRNGVEVETFVGCDSAVHLHEVSLRKPGYKLFVVDVEGDELRLLDPVVCPALKTADIIVECHDFLDGTISLQLSGRFAATHAVEIIKPRVPMYARYEFLSRSPGVMQVLAVTEKRPMPTMWLACWANERGN